MAAYTRSISVSPRLMSGPGDPSHRASGGHCHDLLNPAQGNPLVTWRNDRRKIPPNLYISQEEVANQPVYALPGLQETVAVETVRIRIFRMVG